MDSKRRMVEIHIWNQAFFSQLKKEEKLFYWFVITNCDNVGVYRHNSRLAAFHCDAEISLPEFVDTVNFDQERIELISEGVLWLKGFVADTWGTIAAKNNLGLSCYKLLVKHDLLDRFIREFPNNINIASFREAIEENQKGYGDIPLPQTSPSPAPDLGTAGTINNTINSNDIISNTNEPISAMAEELLELWPNPGNEIYFSEQVKCEDALKRLIDTGIEKGEAKKLVRMKMKKSCNNGVSLEGLLDGIGRKNIA